MDCQKTNKEVREEMTDFWRNMSKKGLMKEVFLDSKADILAVEDRQEILSMLPDLGGKRILELGAGIGRLTGSFAERAAHVTAVDFMEIFVDKNKEVNGHYKNVDFLLADVTKLQFPAQSFDIVLSSWMFMYLTDDEILQFAKNTLSWLTDDGFMFFKESCFHQGGDLFRPVNPTIYRSLSQYTELFQSVSVCVDGIEDMIVRFDIVYIKSCKTFIRIRKSHKQLSWLLQVQKKQMMKADHQDCKSFLNNPPYTKQIILRHEKMFDIGYLSPGGSETTREFVAMLDLQANQTVLDAGCGVGGSDFYMAKTYGVDVLGVDQSCNVIEIAIQRTDEQEDDTKLKVQFQVSDITKTDFDEASFDVVYSRDAILYIPDKSTLFSKFLKWTKPGGKLLISDYCCGPAENHSEEFKHYATHGSQHILYTPQEYGQLIESAGFINVRVENRTNQFVELLDKEKKRFLENKEDLLKELSEEDFQYMVDRWDMKRRHCDTGNFQWGLFFAEKAQ
ncbi:uncharacterized protein LOC144432630 [Glandiceps talaboti]